MQALFPATEPPASRPRHSDPLAPTPGIQHVREPKERRQLARAHPFAPQPARGPDALRGGDLQRRQHPRAATRHARRDPRHASALRDRDQAGVRTHRRRIHARRHLPLGAPRALARRRSGHDVMARDAVAAARGERRLPRGAARKRHRHRRPRRRRQLLDDPLRWPARRRRHADRARARPIVEHVRARPERRPRLPHRARPRRLGARAAVGASSGSTAAR